MVDAIMVIGYLEDIFILNNSLPLSLSFSV